MSIEKQNAGKQTLEQLHERRKQVVRLHKKAIGIMQIVSMTGLSYPAVRACIDLFDAGGWPAVRPTLRGRSPGVERTLTQVQEECIQRTIIDKRPEQLKMDFFLWSRAAVGLLFEQESTLTRCTPRMENNSEVLSGLVLKRILDGRCLYDPQVKQELVKH